MTLDPDAMTDARAAQASSTGASRVRTFLWLVRRELWEHRAVVIAPAAAAAFVAALHFLMSLTSPGADRAGALADPARRGEFQALYAGAAGVIVVTALVVGVLYSLDAIRGERRDRSILFWKSLPVSDLLTVLAKFAIPLVVLPALAVVLAISTHLVMVALQSFAWQVRGADPRLLWARLDLPFLWLGLALGAPFMALWNAPLYAWLLLVSAWARRAAFLWAIAPLAALLAIEHTVLHRTAAHWGVERRLAGGILEPYSRHGPGHEIVWIERLDQFDPLRLYTLPGLWIGVILAGLMIHAAARLRRSRPPV